MAARIGPRECYGIEKADKPAAYSKEMQKHFKKWMKWYGKSFGDFEVSNLFIRVIVLRLVNLGYPVPHCVGFSTFVHTYVKILMSLIKACVG